MGSARSRPHGGLEAEVLACLAAAGEPRTAGEVQAALGGDLAYTTVLTALSRLHAKQALNRTRRGKAHAYELPDGPEAASARVTAHQMHRLLETGGDPARVLSRFVDGLDPDSEQVLRDLLAAHPQERPEGSREDRPEVAPPAPSRRDRGPQRS